MAEQDEPPTVSGRRAKLTRRELLVIMACTIGMLVFCVLAVIQQRWVYVAGIGGFLAVNTVRLIRPPTVIDRDGIRRPWRRVSILAWGQVDHVIQPLYVSYVQVVTIADQTINLTDVEVSETARVAALGDKPVRAEVAGLPRPVTRGRTQREIEADVTRRAVELAAEREQMARSNMRRPKT